MFFTQIKDVYHWIRETLFSLRQRITELFQRLK